jgi:cation diffusion facilitator family transporter
MSDSEGIHDDKNRLSRGANVARISIFAMIVLTISKALVGFLYGAVSLLADAINSFSDIIASTLVWSSLKLASRSPNERFPYGYYRGESLASLFVSLLIIFSGLEIIYETSKSLFSPTQIAEGFIPILTSLFSISTYFLLAKYKKKVGMEIRSRSLITDSEHSIIDVYVGILVFIGIFLSVIGFPLIELGVALILGIYIIFEGLSHLKGSTLSLMDASPYPDRMEEIRKVAMQVPGVDDVHDLKIRRAGLVCFAEMHVSIASGTSVEQAHHVSHRIESELNAILPDLEDVTIHIEPVEKIVKRIAIPVDSTEASSCRTVSHFARAPAFCIIELTTGEITYIHCIQNPGSTAEKKRGILSADALSDEGVDTLVVVDIGRGPYDILTGRLISIFKLPPEPLTVQQVATMCANNELERHEPPQS